MAIYYLSALASGSGNGLSTGAPFTWAQFVATTFSGNDVIWVKIDGTYSSATAKTISQNYVKMEAYTTTPGDGSALPGRTAPRATVMATVANTAILSMSGQGSECNNFTFDGGNLNSGGGLFSVTNNAQARNFVIQNCNNAVSVLNVNNGVIFDFQVLNVTCSGANPAASIAGGIMEGGRLDTINGASGVALQVASSPATISRCDLVSCANAGIVFSNGNAGNYIAELVRISDVVGDSVRFNLTGNATVVLRDSIIKSAGTAINVTGGKTPRLMNVATLGTITGTVVNVNGTTLASNPFNNNTNLYISSTLATQLKALGMVSSDWLASLGGGGAVIGSSMIPVSLL